MLRTLAKSIDRFSARLYGVSAAAIVFIMLLTCADVVMRLFDRPIPGTYELVGYFGAVTVAFALAHTFVERGHISVELLVDRLSARPRAFIEGTGYLVSAVLIGLLAWQSQVYAMDLIETGGFQRILLNGAPVACNFFAEDGVRFREMVVLRVVEAEEAA